MMIPTCGHLPLSFYKKQTGVGERWVANSYMALCPILSLLKARETGLGERDELWANSYM